MLDRCQQKLDGIDFDGECRLILTDILEYQMEAASMVLMNYTLQFLPPNCRLSMLERVYLGLERDGLIVLSEKVAHPDRETDRALTELYFQFKRDNGYSDLEIARKRDSLENVLVPLTVGENIELLEQAGFRNVEILLKWFNFATFVAAK
jgi:tRNA (cmo5U34)-methyltransferase